ncbi:hypothetical protein ROZALSC1DRAFT_20732 [Rozella allomycis CSF55]|uniref:Dynein heavy chain, cytosolic n=1 Tax=Rozella allomycis (strain CSF55) TaxID=988480 RepID=A0A4V1J0D5_ROZAC|nr:hypothetical protein ROZALSC1DRAFT_20732 [Rozella allomycis CSF55]
MSDTNQDPIPAYQPEQLGIASENNEQKSIVDQRQESVRKGSIATKGNTNDRHETKEDIKNDAVEPVAEANTVAASSGGKRPSVNEKSMGSNKNLKGSRSQSQNLSNKSVSRDSLQPRPPSQPSVGTNPRQKKLGSKTNVNDSKSVISNGSSLTAKVENNVEESLSGANGTSAGSLVPKESKIDLKSDSSGNMLAEPEKLKSASSKSRVQIPEKPKVFDVKPVIEHFKSLLIITDYKPFMWKESHESDVTDFIMGRGPHRIVAYVHQVNDEMLLCVGSTVPKSSIDHLMFFVRDNDEKPVTVEEFSDRVQFGSVTGDALHSLLRLMSGIFVPIFLDNEGWPESVRKDFSGQLHKFMAYLTDTTFQVEGHTVLYVPQEKIEEIEIVSKDKDVVQRLESLLLHWTRQIKEVVNNQHNTEASETSGPLEEIKFWKSRCADLSGINVQLNRTEVQKILEVMKSCKSSYLEQFMRLSNLIQDGLLQAQDNLKFLSTLIEPCKELANAEAKNVGGIIQKVLFFVRLIWLNSRFYNTRERLTGLLRKISNEIINRCTSRISLESIFKGNVHSAVAVLNDSIFCGESWKNIYKRNAMLVTKNTNKPWDFDESSIFAQIDAFVQRCRDLLEVCEGQMQFARKQVNGEKLPIPKFGGTKGPETAKSLEDIERAFERQLNLLWENKKHILDVKATKWHDEYSEFKLGVKDLEVMMQNVIVSAFETSPSVEASTYLIVTFSRLAKRDAIKRTVEKKTSDVFQKLYMEISNAKNEFETKKKAPEIMRFHPDFAGSALWARSIVKRVSPSMKIYNYMDYMPKLSIAEEAKALYEAFNSSVEDYVTKTHSDWISSLPVQVMEKLDTPLMERKGVNVLDMKFDKDLIRMMNEIYYWQKLKCDIPFQVQEIYTKKEELRILRDSVLLVVRDYNSVLDTLTPEENMLFKERIRFLDRKINPGLSNLTWSSKGITDHFVKECRKHAHDVQKIVAEFMESSNKIQKSCENMSMLNMWSVENKKVYELSEFEEYINMHLNGIKSKLLKEYNNIKQIVESSFEVFKSDGREVYEQWMNYVTRIDLWVEEALRHLVRRSLIELSNALNGESRNHEAPSEIQALFKVEVVLKQKVEFNPSLQKLEEIVTRLSREFVSSISVIPRLVDNKREAIHEVIGKEDEMLKHLANIQHGLSNNVVKCNEYIHNWDSYKEIWEINKDAFIRRYAKLKPAMSTFESDINRYTEVANNTQKEETLTSVNFVRLDCSPLKHTLVAHCNQWQNKLTTLLNNNASSELKNLHQLFVNHTEKLKRIPTTLDELSESLNLLAQLKMDCASIESQFQPIQEMYQILEKYDVNIKQEEKDQLELLPTTWQVFQITMNESDKTLKEYKLKFKTELMNSIDEFNKNVNVLKEDLMNNGPFSVKVDIEEAFKMIEEYKSKVKQMANLEINLQKGLSVFKIEQQGSKDIEIIATSLDNLMNVWQLNKEFNEKWKEWKIQKFHELKIETIENIINEYQKRNNKLNLKEWDIWQSIKERLNQMKRVIPILKDLKNNSLRQRHWDKLREITGRNIQEDFTLEKIVEINLDQYGDQINVMSEAASKELFIEQGIENIKKAWSELDLEIVPFKNEKGYFKLSSSDSISELLEDNQLTLSGFKVSKYFKPFQSQVDHWERTLSNIMEIIELLLQNMNVQLEKIQKSLSMFLETKRQAFPRFSFVSDSDLLIILGQNKDPNAIQPHLKKCFDSLYRLQVNVGGNSMRRVIEAIGMYSEDGEYVPFNENVLIEGAVEVWLGQIENEMKETLRKQLLGTLNAFKKVKRDKWLKDWPGQLLITAGQINWTSDCTRALLDVEKGEKGALKELKRKQLGNLKKLAELVKSPLNKVERKKLVALITTEVHSRDVIDRMYKNDCSGVNAFEWSSQLRFYWDKEVDNCVIKQINATFQYGYEYLGNSGRLVITPLTDRCFMTLTTALNLNRGGSPQGKAGTGKTESVKDLGKALGYFVLVINCSESLDYKSMGRIFAGLAQTGAWSCFDEFNRVDVEVLSVVALQISCILTAISRRAKTFVFENREIKLKHSAAVFITMNPSYAGRSELPDNVKSLFRPVAMMLPDSAYIAEIVLFAEGFANTKVLSKKVDSLYRLATQQLSKQSHYDYGLRSLTSALRTAGMRKRMDMNAPDDIVLFLSLKDMNIPKLTSDDVPLFMGILYDLFPGIEISQQDNSVLIQAVKEEMVAKNGIDYSVIDYKLFEMWFIFSLIWSVGGSLTEASRTSFDMFLRELEGQFPSKDTVYEYYVNVEKKQWNHWEDKITSGWRYSTNIPFNKILVPTIDTERNEFLINSLCKNKYPVLLVGESGTGKTSIIQNMNINNFLVVNMSAQTSSETVQSIFESKMEKRTKNIYVPAGGKTLTIFIDDLNMPKKDSFGSQQPLELIKHWMDYGFVYDLQKQSIKYLTDIVLLSAMAKPGGARNTLSERFQSRFNVINMTSPNESSLFRIYSTIINQKLQDFEEQVKPLGDIMTSASVDIYNIVSQHLLPTPAKIHYLFSLRDISKVFQGLLRANRDFYDSKESFTKLWVHEVYRVFNDRLVDVNDREWFYKLVDEKLNSYFGSTIKQLCGDKRIPMFGDFNSLESRVVYQEIEDVSKLKNYLEEKMNEHDQKPGSVALDLVLFRDVIEHVVRIARIITLSQGNGLLIGLGGSGRRSLTKLAAYVCNAAVYQIEVTRNYRIEEFKEDIKQLFRQCGIEKKKTVFLLTDTQLTNDLFMEDLSNILSLGHVPNLFTMEEVAEIQNSIGQVSDNLDGIYNYFINKVAKLFEI